MKVNLDTVADWMAEHGEFSYAERIAKLKFWQNSYNNKITDELIREIQEEAMDRYNDWVSDPLD